MTPRNDTTAEDLREHIAHVRTIHFAVVSLSFILVSTWSLNRASSVTRGLEQLREIEQATARWKDDWFTAYVDSAAKAKGWATSPETLFIASQNGWPRVRVVFDSLWTMHLPGDVIGGTGSGNYRVPNGFWGSWPRPTTLADFRTYWDTLGTVVWSNYRASADSVALLTKSRAGDVYRRSDGTGRLTKAAVGPNDCTAHFTLFWLMSSSGIGNPGWDSPNWATWKAKHGDRAVIGQAKCETDGPGPRDASTWAVVVAFQDTIVGTTRGQVAFNAAFQTRWPTIPLDDVFPELASVSRNIDSLSFRQIGAVLADEASRSGDRLEAFGAKIPAEAVALWGIPVLLVAQTYLVLHLVALVSFLRGAPLGRVPPVAWMGLYDSPVSRAASLVSAVVLPTATVVFLAFGQLWRERALMGLTHPGQNILSPALIGQTLFLTSAAIASGFAARRTGTSLRDMWRDMGVVGPAVNDEQVAAGASNDVTTVYPRTQRDTGETLTPR